MSPRNRPLVKLAALRAFSQRFSLLFLLLAAIGLMMLGRLDSRMMDGARARVTDAVAPILDAFSRPAAGVAGVIESVQELGRLREEKAALESEIALLRQFRDVAHRLEAENLSLRMLLNYQPEEPHGYLTARVIADNSGSFVRSLAVHLGAENGVRDGQAVIGGQGLIGRVVQTGDSSARILLISDLNARIPVIVEHTRQRAILGGDNTAQPRLLYVPPEVELEVGDRIVTSGDGGMFPAGLPIGVVAAVEGGTIRVAPFDDLNRLEFVRILDFPARREPALMRPIPGYRP